MSPQNALVVFGFVFWALFRVVDAPQDILGCRNPLQNITSTEKMCYTLVLRDDWQFDPDKIHMQMKDGIVSLDLTNLVNDDNGRVKPGGQRKDQDKDGGEQDRRKKEWMDGYVELKVAQKNIIPGPGQNASLPCQICVKKQVDLQDQEMKGGVTSTLLDAMTAEHRVAWEKTIRGWATLKLISSIVPRFFPPGLSSVDPPFNRSVYLQDTQMTHGIDDCGKDKLLKPGNNFTLTVVPPGQPGGHTEDGFRTPCNHSFSDGFSSAI